MIACIYMFEFPLLNIIAACRDTRQGILAASKIKVLSRNYKVGATQTLSLSLTLPPPLPPLSISIGLISILLIVYVLACVYLNGSRWR
jgi:hypothetical protein